MIEEKSKKSLRKQCRAENRNCAGAVSAVQMVCVRVMMVMTPQTIACTSYAQEMDALVMANVSKVAVVWCWLHRIRLFNESMPSRLRCQWMVQQWQYACELGWEPSAPGANDCAKKSKTPNRALGMACPLKCSGNGICDEGTCKCDPGFVGVGWEERLPK